MEMLAKSRQSILPVTLQLNQPTDFSAHFPHFPQTLIELMSFDPSSCQWVKYASAGAIFMSAKRPPISIATNAVMSAIVNRSPATNWCPFSSPFIRSRR